jgi:hypothetical protein
MWIKSWLKVLSIGSHENILSYCHAVSCMTGGAVLIIALQEFRCPRKVANARGVARISAV